MEKAIIQEVVGQALNMYYNNYFSDFGNSESFECWCENGDIFFNDTESKLTDIEKRQCSEFMEMIAPFVDRLTREIDEHIDYHNI